MHAAVVGGGIAGLAAATQLAEEGHAVTLLERRPTLGGRAYSVVDDTTGDVIDNGQHLVMGCYRALRGLLARIGATHRLRFQDDLDVALVREDGTRLRLKASPLPAPLHLLGGLLGFGALSAWDKLRLVKAAAAIKRGTASDLETVEQWLDRAGQSPEARATFWHPLALATLNDDPRTASAKLLEAVLREAFLGSRDDARLGFPACGLSELYVEDAARFVEARGGRVVTAAPVGRVLVEDGVARGLELEDGERVSADAVVAAVPPRALYALAPEPLRQEPYFANLLRLESSPIVSVHLWLEHPVACEAVLGLVGRPVHWIFARERYLSLVTSAARALIDRPARELVALAAAEVARVLPGAKVRHARVLKEREATIAHGAGTEWFRPGTRSPVEGLFVAGDHVRTGLPATLESAVRSGEEAAALAAAFVPPPARRRPAFVPLEALRPRHSGSPAFRRQPRSRSPIARSSPESEGT